MDKWGQSDAGGRPHWLNRERLTLYPRLVVALFLITGTTWVVLSGNMIDLNGKPLGYDFITFWGASYLGLAGHAADAYDIPLLFQAQQVAVPATARAYAWYYPPSFFLLALPLALMPYVTAYWAFMLSTLAAYWLALRQIVPQRAAWWCVAAFPGLWVNLFHGQNGFLTAALAGGAILAMPGRPAIAGVLIGLLVIKPHLAILFPVALIACRAWRTFCLAAVSAVALMAGGVVALGVPAWKAWLASLEIARLFLETGVLPLAKMPTVFAAFRLTGLPLTLSYGAHAAVALISAIVVWRVWRHSADWAARGATLMTASLLVSPYLFDYDLAWVAFPIAWLATSGLRTGWLRGEREVLAGAWVLPMLASPIASATGLQLAPAVLCALLWAAARRAGISPQGAGASR